MVVGFRVEGSLSLDTLLLFADTFEFELRDIARSAAAWDSGSDGNCGKGAVGERVCAGDECVGEGDLCCLGGVVEAGGRGGHPGLEIFPERDRVCQARGLCGSDFTLAVGSKDGGVWPFVRYGLYLETGEMGRLVSGGGQGPGP